MNRIFHLRMFVFSDITHGYLTDSHAESQLNFWPVVVSSRHIRFISWCKLSLQGIFPLWIPTSFFYDRSVFSGEFQKTYLGNEIKIFLGCFVLFFLYFGINWSTPLESGSTQREQTWNSRPRTQHSVLKKRWKALSWDTPTPRNLYNRLKSLAMVWLY